MVRVQLVSVGDVLDQKVASQMEAPSDWRTVGDVLNVVMAGLAQSKQTTRPLSGDVTDEAETDGNHGTCRLTERFAA